MTINTNRRPKRQKNKTEFPKWLYDKDGNGKIYNAGDDIPKGLFADLNGEKPYTPAAKAKSPAKDTPQAKPENPNKGLAKELGLQKKDLVDWCSESKIDFPADATADDLAAIYQAAVDASEEEDDDAEDEE